MPRGTEIDTVAPSRTQVVAWRNALFVTFLLAGLAISSWLARLPAARDSLHLSPAQLGGLIFAVAAGSIVGLLASSHVVARFGTVATITGGMLAVGVGVVTAGIGATSGNFIVTFIGLLIFGANSGAVDVAMNVSGAANERALGRSIMPVFHAFFSFGTMLGAGLGALAEFIHVPVAIHLGIIAVIAVVTILIARRFILPADATEANGEVVADDDRSRTWRGRLGIWRDPRTILIGLLVLSAAFSEGTANDWLAIASVDGHGVSNATGALIFGIFVTAMTAGRLGGIFVLDRFGRVAVLRASFTLVALGLLLFIFVPNAVIAIAGAVLWGFGAALGFPVGMSAAADDPKTAAARVSAVATIGYFAFLVGPPAIGLLGQSIGVIHGLLVTLVLAAIGAIVSGAAREPGNTRARATIDTFTDPQAP
jgi:MFS family permease